MGKVFLVGAGPGDPELLTVKALRLLQCSEAVLHDGLVSRAILDLVNSQAVIIDIGKRCGQKLLTQDEINKLLITYAGRVNSVVRLKGGDPSVFGRAGEEIDALVEAGIPFEIVPGITTALAAAAAAKRPLTDRRSSSSLVLVTAHRGSGADAVEWNRLVTSGSTLAIYMPGTNYSKLSTDLISAGLDRHTPCVIVSQATLGNQQIFTTTVGRLGVTTALPAPAHILVGRCMNPATDVDLMRSAFSIRADDATENRKN